MRKDRLSGGDRSVHGRALLMFKGMATWMRAVGEAAVPPRIATAGRSEKQLLPAGVEQNLINIVATMTLAAAKESRP